MMDLFSSKPNSPPLDLFQQVHVLLISGAQEVNAVHQVGSHKSGLEGKNHLPQPLVMLLLNVWLPLVISQPHEDHLQKIITISLSALVRAQICAFLDFIPFFMEMHPSVLLMLSASVNSLNSLLQLSSELFEVHSIVSGKVTLAHISCFWQPPTVYQ